MSRNVEGGWQIAAAAVQHSHALPRAAGLPPRRPAEVLEVRAQHLPSPSLLFCSLPLSLPPESMIPERPLRNLETTNARQCRKRGDHTVKALPLLWRGKTHCSRSFCQPERQGRTSFILALFASTHTTLAPSFLVCCPRGRRIGDEWPSGGRLGFGGPYTSLC